TLLGYGLLIALVTAYLMLRPSEPLAQLTAADEAELRALLARQGRRDSLGYFALRRDKSVVWSSSGKAAVSYRAVHGVAMASGGPCRPRRLPGGRAAVPRHPAGGDERPARRGRRLAGRQRGARVLDGAVPARRPCRWGLCRGRRAPRRGAARPAALRSVGRG